MRSSLILLLAMLLAGCTWHADDRLARIADLVSVSPRDAIDSLSALDRETLGEADRNYYDFLSVKAADKAFIRHASDTLILRVVDYAGRHQSHGYYPEALYYAGRVYSDMGDNPTALRYFHDALDLLPPNKENRHLRGNILSQTGLLLINLRLYDEAIPYMNEVIDIDRVDKDSVNLFYDLLVIGHLYMNAEDYDMAEACFREALHESRNLPRRHAAKTKVYLAKTKHMRNDIDSALFYIKGTKEDIDSINLNFVLANATSIYLSANMLDTAYQTAKEIINSNDPALRQVAYNRILGTSLQKFLDSDEISKYLSEYVDLLESYYDDNQNQLALAQQASYNYRLHDLARQKAEQQKEHLKTYLITSLLAVLIAIIIALYLKYRNQKTLLKLHRTLELVETLSVNLDKYKPAALAVIATNNDKENLRARLRDKIDSINIVVDTPIAVLDSAVYKKLNEYVRNDQSLPDDSPLWLELENVVLESSPDFKSNVQLLSSHRLSDVDYHTLLLIKCGFSPTKVSVLSQCERGTINSRRIALAAKLFGAKIELKRFDRLIRLL